MCLYSTHLNQAAYSSFWLVSTIAHWASFFICICNICIKKETRESLEVSSNLFWMLGVKRLTKQSVVSLDGNYVPCMISHKAWWSNPHKPYTTNEVDWRTHFLGDLIINYCLSGKLGRVLWIPVTSLTDWRLPDNGWADVLSVATVFHASWCAQSWPAELTELLTCADTLENHYSWLSHSHSHTHTGSIQRHLRLDCISVT